MSSLLPTYLDVSNKGQILIPVAVRKALGIKPNGKVILYPLKKEKRVLIEPFAKDPIEAACGILADKTGSSWSEELIKDRKKELKKEEKDL